MDIGSIVECVDDVFSPIQMEKLVNRPKHGNYYMVREILEFEDNKVGLLLEEIRNAKIISPVYGEVEPNFSIERFREIEGLPSIEEILEGVFEEELVEVY